MFLDGDDLIFMPVVFRCSGCCVGSPHSKSELTPSLFDDSYFHGSVTLSDGVVKTLKSNIFIFVLYIFNRSFYLPSVCFHLDHAFITMFSEFGSFEEIF